MQSDELTSGDTSSDGPHDNHILSQPLDRIDVHGAQRPKILSSLFYVDMQPSPWCQGPVPEIPTQQNVLSWQSHVVARQAGSFKESLIAPCFVTRLSHGCPQRCNIKSKEKDESICGYVAEWPRNSFCEQLAAGHLSVQTRGATENFGATVAGSVIEPTATTRMCRAWYDSGLKVPFGGICLY